MGVPITYLDFFNPEQFILVGNEYSLHVAGGRGYVNGQRMYSRIFIQRNPETPRSIIHTENNLFEMTTK